MLFVRAAARNAVRQQLEAAHSVGLGYSSARLDKKHRFKFEAQMDVLRSFADGADDKDDDDAEGDD